MPETSAAARYGAEFLGTFVLVATVCGNVLSSQGVWGGVSIGSALTVMIYGLGKSSGAHLNPAVSLAALLSGKTTAREACAYTASQIVAGVVAAMVSTAIYGGGHIDLSPVSGFSWWQAALSELFYTFMLSFVVLNTACSSRNSGNQFYGLAIGFVVVAGAYGAGSISMGCFNPAVAVALDVSALVAGAPVEAYSLLYILFEFAGAALAAVLFRVVRPEEFQDVQEGLTPVHSKLVSEFLGTFMLVLTVGLNVLTSSPAAVFSIAASLMCMIFALGSVSGAHFNPAVTAAVLCSRRGKISVGLAAQYVAVQFLAGVAAAGTVRLLTSREIPGLKPESSGWEQVMAAELVYTFVLAFTVLSVASVKSGRVLTEFFGLAIGFCVIVGGHSIGSISSGSLNPAVSVGLAVASPAAKLWHLVPYALVELLAGGLAAAAFYGTQPSEFFEIPEAESPGRQAAPNLDVAAGVPDESTITV